MSRKRVAHLRPGGRRPGFDRRDLSRGRGIPVDPDGVLVLGTLWAPLVPDVVDGSHADHLGGSAIRDHGVAGLQLTKCPQLVGFTTDGRLRPVVREVLAERLAKGLLALELGQVTDLMAIHFGDCRHPTLVRLLTDTLATANVLTCA